MSRLLVRRPSPRLADGEITHIERQPINPALALRQWEGYVAQFASRGWEVVEVEAADAQPDGVFIEDAVIVFGDLAVLARSGAESRRGEKPGAEAAARALGLTVHAIEEPGTLDGGDILKIGMRVYVGDTSRTNEAGIAQLRAILEPTGREVVVVPVTTALHLKSAITALPDGTVIGHDSLVEAPEQFPAFRAVPEVTGTAVVVLDETTVLMSASAPETAQQWRDAGLEVVTADITEFEKLEGCVTCLSVRVR
ncbi:N(G),N(G)-dimethylarginine dimethylaminohydrolase [Serinibacter arcticus]|uniref:N(G),N(G)-dimethylarginine dimethylaminohydrolase n=1 Tax=Serinibacter arcticus TaxID=1655435 RepID=A0A2U1ZTV7_9MICO|nr:dimethylargininase [Serinibacter arcticus]PWD50415.1 N(G),N(G)-dimethylarginine dimethylaminohydrolase [Serinibacter arcticus]